MRKPCIHHETKENHRRFRYRSETLKIGARARRSLPQRAPEARFAFDIQTTSLPATLQQSPSFIDPHNISTILSTTGESGLTYSRLVSYNRNFTYNIQQSSSRHFGGIPKCLNRFKKSTGRPSCETNIICGSCIRRMFFQGRSERPLRYPPMSGATKIYSKVFPERDQIDILLLCFRPRPYLLALENLWKRGSCRHRFSRGACERPHDEIPIVL